MTEIKPHAAHWGYFDAVVENGRIVGTRPFGRDSFPGTLIDGIPDIVHAPSRIERPHVREGWLRGERRGSTRGKDRFVAVSWDQATRLVAEEVRRVRAEHGDASVFGGSYGWSSAGRFHHARSQLQRFLGLGGGFTSQVTNYSYGAGMTLMPHVLGTNDVVQGPVTDWRSIIGNARLMLCFGGLPVKNGLVTAGGGGAHDYVPMMKAAVEAGLRFVNISPFRGDAADFLGAQWVPIRPGGDAAMVLAMIQAIIAAGLEDRDFLARCTVGWERLRGYVMGEADGVAKTPEWASPLCEVPAEVIRALALEAAGKPTMVTATWSIQRAEHGEQPWWALVGLASALGGIGKPGQGIAFGYGSINGMGNSRRNLPSVNLPATRNPVQISIPVSRVTELLERPGEVMRYNGRDIHLPDTRMVFWSGGNPFHHHQDLNRLARALSLPDTVVVSEPWWTSIARHADIVLPATTTLERNDIASSSRDRFVRAMHQAVPPQGQARNDHDAFADIADALGFRERFTAQRDEDAWLRYMYDQFRRACAAMGEEVPDFDRFWAEGHVEFALPEEDFVQFADFARDPEAAPLNTPSGKVELYSETIAGFGDPGVAGHAVWMAPREWLGGDTSRFPLHLLSDQPPVRLHSQLDTSRGAAARKIQGREPIRMNPADAAARGFSAGDIVRVFNDRGACLAGVVVTDELRPGVVSMSTGAWWDPQETEKGPLCVHGNPNVLTQDVGTSLLGQGCAAHSCLVQVEAWTGPLPEVSVHRPPATAGLPA
jgi:biotin/methionine sulfoxide reductase